jgi:hypothetical protein
MLNEALLNETLLNGAMDTPAEADVRFLGYRLEVVRQWPPSPRKVAAAEAISQRLTSIARSALVRPDIADLLHLSCQLLDDFFAADTHAPHRVAVRGNRD